MEGADYKSRKNGIWRSPQLTTGKILWGKVAPPRQPLDLLPAFLCSWPKDRSSPGLFRSTVMKTLNPISVLENACSTPANLIIPAHLYRVWGFRAFRVSVLDLTV